LRGTRKEPMFEHKKQKLATRQAFLRRMLLCVAVAAGVIAAALGIGIIGYHWTAGLTWIDSLLNASMILGGMGPVNPLTSDGAKLFASFYALFSGLVFIVVTGILLGPVVHRIMHRFHIDQSDLDGRKPRA